MIETPIVGRFQGEGRRLIFGPPLIYSQFVRVVAGVGIVMAIAPVLPIELPLYSAWWLSVGMMLIVAAIGAALSLQSVTFDLKERTYRRWQGPGLMPRYKQGRLDELDAVVVLAEPQHNRLVPGVTYHVVLHWKPDLHQPVLILHQDTRTKDANLPLNAAAGPVLQLGARYAQALGVKFYDNTHFPSACPVPLW